MIWNIQQGDAPVSWAAIERSIEPEMTRRGWPQRLRDEALLLRQIDPDHPKVAASMAALATFEADLASVKATNAFNHELAAYRAAVARLARYRLADGKPEEQIGTGTYDENGDEIMETIPAIDPLVGGTVEVPVYDDEGNQTGTETQPDEVQQRIDADDAERAAAQVVVDGASQEVIDFDA